ncbi:unnamed protein product [Cryptosporidium hominis]|uniref:Uncharacterized protein n=1 Tax=Cryptosporidium hominis TaxID=237895 RepID=A0A0S4TIQ7_CRYHO|nr:hypothetical protein [Cryptosporidium hominis TU502]OLQ17962.1 hypothetical protein ChTU502y2012_407g1450 [Cryptosporidium hominis]PPA64078.1 hypothetical protein ChUKH1_04705 [Cryptosporidium hominis]PPS93987.1 Uncharacterized protein GY17_00003013 [Cryptosporidium hominis]CUV07282.1 unnamed protein product [Cryptosporidium hominis]|eukprot:PPS93987.1 Uncharacterized protein GY17_00003013 [Cryptosporidium hominis]
MMTMDKKHNSFFSNLKDKYKVFSMNNAKHRIFSRKKAGSKKCENEKIKGINVSFENTYSDSIVNSSNEHISSNCMSSSSDNMSHDSNNCISQERQGSKFEYKLSKSTTKIENNTAINSNSSPSLNEIFSDNSSTSLFSDSSTSLNSKYKSKYSSDTQSSTYRSNIQDYNQNTDYNCSDTSRKENISQGQGIPIKKRIENTVEGKEKTKPQLYKRNNSGENNNYRESKPYLNKEILDILNSKNLNREEKRTTQQVVAIEDLGVDDKNIEINATSRSENNSYRQEVERCSFKDLNVYFGWETPLVIPIITEPDCCYQSSYSNYDVLIDYACIDGDKYHLCSFIEGIH